ncbi:hypothetical protein HMI55_004947, partial [Coelomomyces lativittatus]
MECTQLGSHLELAKSNIPQLPAEYQSLSLEQLRRICVELQSMVNEYMRQYHRPHQTDSSLPSTHGSPELNETPPLLKNTPLLQKEEELEKQKLMIQELE